MSRDELGPITSPVRREPIPQTATRSELVDKLRREAMRKFLAKVRSPWSVDELAERVAAVGETIAAAEAIQARLHPTEKEPVND